MSRRILLISTVSAVSGIGGKPRRVLVWPSCMTPWLQRKGSMGWMTTGIRKLAAYSSARR